MARRCIGVPALGKSLSNWGCIYQHCQATADSSSFTSDDAMLGISATPVRAPLPFQPSSQLISRPLQLYIAEGSGPTMYPVGRACRDSVRRSPSEFMQRISVFPKESGIRNQELLQIAT